MVGGGWWVVVEGGARLRRARNQKSRSEQVSAEDYG